MNHFVIRPAVSDDFHHWQPLWQAYLRFYETSIDDETTVTTWNRITSPDEDHKCLICDDKSGQISGFAIYLFHRSSWATTWNCLIEDVYVKEGSRGNGIASRLIETIFSDADKRSCYRTYWQTDQNNIEARRLYEKLGRLAPVVQYRR